MIFSRPCQPAGGGDMLTGTEIRDSIPPLLSPMAQVDLTGLKVAELVRG